MPERSAGDGLPNGRSPLAGAEPHEGPVSLVERTGLGALVVRGSGPAFFATTATVLGVALPVEPNTTQGRRELLVLWLGPDEWLLRMRVGASEATGAALRAGLAAEHAAVVDVSDRACVLRVSGKAAREVLAQGCPLDLHPRVFRPGSCSQSRFLKAPVLIHQVDDRPTYDIETPRSCARYLRDCLVEATRVGDIVRSC